MPTDLQPSLPVHERLSPERGKWYRTACGLTTAAGEPTFSTPIAVIIARPSSVSPLLAHVTCRECVTAIELGAR